MLISPPPLSHSSGTQEWPTVSLDGPALIFGGPYGNLEATKAVLNDAAMLGIPPQRIICTGDVVAYCADPQATVDLIRESGIHVVMGNCEESLGFGADDCGCGFTEGSTCDALSAAWYAHADRQLDQASRAWMRGLPRRIDVRIGGFRLAAVHGAVDRINRFLFASDDEAEFRHQLDLVGCDGIVAGHCGIPFTRMVGKRIWHNAGAIGMPANDGTLRTWYSIIDNRDHRLEIRHEALDYDHRTAAAKMRKAGLPEGYATAVSDSGLWPSCDVLPLVELAKRGHALKSETITCPPPRFTDPQTTATGAPRATVPLKRLETLWFNTGTLCNLACDNCFMDSSPKNDALAYIRRSEARDYMAEAKASFPTTKEIGFTGGEPFMNPDITGMIEDALGFDFRVLVLTNAMKPMQHLKAPLLDLHQRHPGRISIRVSLDHYEAGQHEKLRGPKSWEPTIQGLVWLADNGFDIAVAGRMVWGEGEADMRAGYGRLFSELGIALDAGDPARLVLFPEMDDGADVPEISEACWGILSKSPDQVMCATSRMVIRRKEAAGPSVVACTLLPFDARFELGQTLDESAKAVSLNHRHCAKFCVLGGASCSPHHS